MILASNNLMRVITVITASLFQWLEARLQLQLWSSWVIAPYYECDALHYNRVTRTCIKATGRYDPGVHCWKLGRPQSTMRFTNCTHRPMYYWSPWGPYEACFRGRKNRRRVCIESTRRDSRTYPVPCRRLVDTQITQCHCDENWTHWTECVGGKRSRSRCGGALPESCLVYVPPVWSEWGLWTDCFGGERSRSRNCYVDEDRRRSYTRMIDCTLDEETEPELCLEDCDWLEFAGLGKQKLDVCYSLAGGILLSGCFLWCFCLVMLRQSDKAKRSKRLMLNTNLIKKGKKKRP